MGVAVYDGDGTGSFGGPNVIALPAYPSGPMVAADLDGDLELDLP
jgi:hypothetical protein